MEYDKLIFDAVDKVTYVGSDGAMVVNRLVKGMFNTYEQEVEFYFGSNGYRYENKWLNDVYYGMEGFCVYNTYSHDGVYEHGIFFNFDDPGYKYHEFLNESEMGSF